MISFFALMLACGPKEPPAAPTAPVPAPVEKPDIPEPPPEDVEEPEEEVTPEPEAEPEPEPIQENTDMNVILTYANGETKSGRVIRLERSSKYNAFDEWLDEERKLKVSLEGKKNTAIDATWAEIKSITIKPGKVPKDVDCSYESDYSPWLYVCVLKTTTKVVTKDKKRWVPDSKYKWRFTFEDGSTEEFWIQKTRALEQDQTEVTLTTGSSENRALYQKLQEQLRESTKGNLVVKIEVK